MNYSIEIDGKTEPESKLYFKRQINKVYIKEAKDL